ncbi:hypothetical protein [Streptosporangium sp. OZ121]|uniref:hypothetical protein n=1 Tax=Streptosporangium sp. OZ121 TaxID=3444183 RepID=UPI003F7A0F4C
MWNLGIPLGVDRQFVQDLAADMAAKEIGPLIECGAVALPRLPWGTGSGLATPACHRRRRATCSGC